MPPLAEEGIREDPGDTEGGSLGLGCELLLLSTEIARDFTSQLDTERE